MKKMLIINGSRVENGNTSYLLDSVIQQISSITQDIDIDVIDPKHYRLKPVDEPKAAFLVGDSVYRGIGDDYFRIKQMIDKSDFLLLASPVYYANVTSDMKLFIDRFCHLAHLFYWAGKPSAVVACADGRGQQQVGRMLESLLDGFGMPRVAKLIYANSNPPDENDLNEFAKKILYGMDSEWHAHTTEEMEAGFQYWKRSIKQQDEKSSEYSYWNQNGLFQSASLQEYIDSI